MSPHVDAETSLAREGKSASPSRCPSAHPGAEASHRNPVKVKGDATTDIGYYHTEYFAKVRGFVDWMHRVTTNGVTVGADASALLPRFRSGPISVSATAAH